jgi:hypothetical protein
MLNENSNRTKYDLPTAVTFLLAGLALGATLVVILSPLKENSDTVRSSKNRPSHGARRLDKDEVLSE